MKFIIELKIIYYVNILKLIICNIFSPRNYMICIILSFYKFFDSRLRHTTSLLNQLFFLAFRQLYQLLSYLLLLINIKLYFYFYVNLLYERIYIFYFFKSPSSQLINCFAVLGDLALCHLTHLSASA